MITVSFHAHGICQMSVYGFDHGYKYIQNKYVIQNSSYIFKSIHISTTIRYYVVTYIIPKIIIWADWSDFQSRKILKCYVIFPHYILVSLYNNIGTYCYNI